MATGQKTNPIRQIRRMALLGFTDISDTRLLDFFLTQQDDVAFEALVKRHGSMVLNVCQRILKDSHDAEDAFQATFLVLIRKAASLGNRELLGNWLYGVALRAALKMKQAKLRRRFKEGQVRAMSSTRSSAFSAEQIEGLDHELAKLPQKYRAAIVFCDLEGMTRVQAARKLGWPIGTLNWRLAKARSIVASRLKRHDLTISSNAIAIFLQQNASASVPPSLVAATTKLATLYGNGRCHDYRRRLGDRRFPNEWSN